MVSLNSIKNYPHLKSILFLIIVFLFITIVRIPTFLEPWMDTDEKIYLAVGHGIANGQKLYLDVWDNKPPLIYLVYALSVKLFGSAVWGVRIFGLLFSFLGIASFYSICKNVLKLDKLKFIIAFEIFIFLSIFGFEALRFNGEGLFVPLVLAGINFLFLMDRKIKTTKIAYFILGSIFISLACFSKTHAVLESIFMGLVWIIYLYKNQISFKSIMVRILTLSFIVLLPYIFSAIYFGSIEGGLEMFYYSILGFGGDYIGRNTPIIFGIQFDFISNLQLRFIVLLISLGLNIYFYLKKQFDFELFFVLSWFFITIFTVLLSERNYPHYLIQLFAPLCLVISLSILFLTKGKEKLIRRIQPILLLVVVFNLVIINFTGNTILPHYENILEDWGHVFNSGFTNYKDYKSFSQNQKSIIAVENIKTLSNSNDYIYIVDNSPELYALSNRKVGYRHVTDFQYDEGFDKIYSNILDKNVSLIVVKNSSPVYQEFNKRIINDYRLEKVDEIDFEYWVKG